MKTITAGQRSERIRKGVFKFITVKVLVISTLFLASLYSFILIVHEAVLEDEQTFDDKVFDFFAAHSSPRFVQVMRYFTFFGSHTFLIPAYVALISYYLFQKKYRSSLHIAIIGISSTLLMFLLKELFARSRPDLPLVESVVNNYSFPSGHALSSFIFFGIFIYIIWHSTRMPLAYKWVSIPALFAFTLTIAMSRVVLRAHYPTDVIASYCLGNLWTVMSLEIMRKMSKKRRRF